MLVISIAISDEIEYREMEMMDHQPTLFMEWFYDTFYQSDHEHLPACKYTAHGLLHLLHDIQNWGSASYYWQFPAVFSIRICIMLIDRNIYIMYQKIR